MLNVYHPSFDLRMEVLLRVPQPPHTKHLCVIAEEVLGGSSYDDIREIRNIIAQLRERGFGVRVLDGKHSQAEGRQSVQAAATAWELIEAAAETYWETVYEEEET